MMTIATAARNTTGLPQNNEAARANLLNNSGDEEPFVDLSLGCFMAQQYGAPEKVPLNKRGARYAAGYVFCYVRGTWSQIGWPLGPRRQSRSAEARRQRNPIA